MIVDGKAISNELLASIKERRARIEGPITLGIVISAGDPVTESFVRIKSKIAADLNIGIVRYDITEPTTEAAMDGVRAFKYDPAIDGVVVQLPMPAGIDLNAVLSEMPADKDIDGINPFLRERERIVRAPVALAVEEILNRTGTIVQGARVVVVGAGRLVGLPTALLLRERGADVKMFTLDQGRIEDLKDADIIVLGAGQPHFIKPEHIKDGVVIIDAGTSESSGMIQGDADPACAKKASVFTPVPGGVGPIAVAMIFKNILDLARRD